MERSAHLEVDHAHLQTAALQNDRPQGGHLEEAQKMGVYSIQDSVRILPYSERTLESFDALFRREKDRIHHDRVHEKSKVLFHSVLFFVEGENLPGVCGAFAFLGNIG